MVPFLWSALAAAEPASFDGQPAEIATIDPALPGASGDGVVGGDPVKRGKWDDAAGILMFGAFVGCTGTLIGPDVVLTAGHCVLDYPVTHVLLGSKDSATDQGERLEVEQVIEYPDSQSTFDVALLLLKQRSKYAPRELALDCVVDDYLYDGAPVQIVGFGMTSAAGDDYFNTTLNEAPSVVLDKNCDESTLNGVFAGCRGGLPPGSELAAGGGDTNACYGDSGGPLYLKTDRGDYVVGVASRLFLGSNPSAPCSTGQIWVRPDAVVRWIEDQVGGRELAYPSCNEPPDAVVDPIVTRKNRAGATAVAIDDPDGDPEQASIEVVEPPAHGAVAVDGDTLTYEPERGFVGADAFTVAITDAGTDDRRTGDPATIEAAVEVVVEGGCGCATGGPGSGAGLFAAIVAFTWRRRARPTDFGYHRRPSPRRSRVSVSR